MADDGHAGGVDEQAGLDAFGFGEGAEGVIAGVVAPVRGRDGGQGVGELGEQLGNLRIFPEFGLGGGIDLEVVAEKGARPAGKVRKQADARTQQVDRSSKPLIVFFAGVADTGTALWHPLWLRPFFLPEPAAL